MKRYLMIKNIGRLVTMNGEGEYGLGVIENAACLIKQGRIEWFGKAEDSPQVEEYLVSYLDAGGKAIMPGLVDCHTHIVHGGSRENEAAMRARGKSYEDIAKEGGGILSTVKATREAGFEDLCEKALKRADDALENGITTMEVKSGYGLDLETEIKILKVVEWLETNSPVSFVPTFLGAHVIPLEFKDKRDKYVDIIVNEMIPRVAEEGLARYCDVFVEKIGFTRDEAVKITEAGKKYGLSPKLHVDQLSNVCGAELAADIKAVSADHLEYASDAGIRRLAESGTVAVLIPGSTFYLGGSNYARARKMIESGVTVAVSTDYNPGSTPCLDLFLMATIGVSYLHMTIEESLKAITVNAAKAIELTDGRGMIKKDGIADLLILDAVNEYFPVYSYAGKNVKTVIKDGKIAYERRN